MFDMLNTIAQDLGAESSPQTLARCAEFLGQASVTDNEGLEITQYSFLSFRSSAQAV
jgi:hypothetical protein